MILIRSNISDGNFLPSSSSKRSFNPLCRKLLIIGEIVNCKLTDYKAFLHLFKRVRDMLGMVTPLANVNICGLSADVHVGIKYHVPGIIDLNVSPFCHEGRTQERCLPLKVSVRNSCKNKVIDGEP